MLCWLLYYCVYYFLYLGKDCARRKHFTIFIRTVYPYEFRVKLALSSIDGSDTFLEFDVSLMDVLTAFQVVSVSSSSLTLQLRLDESDRYVKEYIQVGNRKTEISVFGVEYPVSESVGFSFV